MPQTIGDSTLGAIVGTEREDTLDQGPPTLADICTLLGSDEIAGRFALTSVLGAGAMGIVLAARDILLDRAVALKILRRESSDPKGEMHERIVREARALAQVAHPNVITVFDVGRIAGRTYVAMELVRGVDLRRWLARESDKRARVATLVQAGRGLAAAHAVGVVHRDFKPENVLVGDDHRVRVADFGLAHTVSPGEPSTLRSGSTATFHALIGTPSYMAPEQFVGAPAGVHTDQFGFFVALYEALHDKRPFTGNTIYELAAALLHAEPAAPPLTSGLVRRLWPVIQRGLSREPSRRFPDMDAALAAIERAAVAHRAWRLPLLLGVSTIAVAAAAWPSDPPSLCERMQERRLALWNDDARARLRDSIHAAGTSFADTTANTVERELDAWIGAWDREHDWACSSEQLDMRHDCLGSALTRVGALTHALENASAADVRLAVAAVGELPRPDHCRAPSMIVGDPVLRERFAALEAASQLAHTGEGLRIARELVVATEDGSDPASAVQAHLGLGLLLEEIEDHDEAQSELSAAFFAAVALGDEASATEAAAKLAHLHTFALSGFDDAETWVRHAEAHARDDDHRFIAALAAAHLDYARGRYDEACNAFTRAIELPHVTGVRLAALHFDLGFTRHLQGRQDEAAAQLDHSLDLFEAELGPTHPDVGDVVLARSQVAVVSGDLDYARALAERGLAIVEGAYGSDHSDVAKALTHLAETMPDPADDARVLALLERAVAIIERTRGADNPATAAVLTDLANRRGAAGDHAQALAQLERALRVADESLGEHPFVAAAMHNVARELDSLGRHEEARAMWMRAIALRERLLGAEDPGLLPSLQGLGKLEIAAGRRAEGLAALERGWAIVEAHADRSFVAGLIAWNLALAIDRDDPARALVLAREGLARVKKDPQRRRDVAGEIERWIAAHST